MHQIELEIQNDELRATQAALEQSRNRYHELYDFAPVGYFCLDENNLIREVNLVGAELLGLERALLIRQRFSRFIAPDSQDAFYFHRKRVLASEGKQVCELVLVNKDGSRFHAQLQTTSVVDDAAKTDRLRIAVMDITARVRLEAELKVANEELEQRVEARASELIKANLELRKEIVLRRQIELELQKSEEKYRIVVENANEGIIVTQNSEIKFSNANFENITGYTREELAGLPIVDLVHPDDVAMVMEYQARAMREQVQPQSYNARVVGKAGQIRWLRNKRVLIEWNDRPAVLSFLDDITAQMHSEKVLKEIDEQLKNIFLESPIGIAVYDAHGLMYGVNKSYLTIYGMPDATRVLGTSLFDDPLLSSETKERLLAGNAIREEVVVDFPKAVDGGVLDPTRTKELYLDVLITPLGMSTGDAVVGYMTQIQDITEEKGAQRSIHALSQQLIRAHEAERLMISRELHDRVGQDLSTLKIGLDSLRHEHRIQNPECLEKLTAFSDLTQQAIMVVRDLAYELRPPGLDQFGFVRAMTQYGKDFAEKTGLDIRMTFTGVENSSLDVDAEINLYRLVQESLNNIHKHALARRAVVRMVASFPKIILRIEDDGLGFDPVQRMAGATAEKRMGLHSMRERATLLGGTMRIRSRLGKGTQILVELPYERKPHDSEKNSIDR
ncbi:PAS domain S-box protein [Desulfonatronum thiodismutans]|uniref:PAS domain S-box protein n=1 Tax=Desulfonatronum thiodismutans TaxID=159290 RepID=UPI00068E4262|nr:PAS domain S-box protein [Desulfonatronum thiodismutans]